MFRDQAKQDLNMAIGNIIDVVRWIHPKQLADTIGERIGGEDDFKYAMILGSKQSNAVWESGDMHLGLLYLSVGKTYPQHAREANEMFYIMAGVTQSGATLQHLTTINCGEFISYDIAAPRVFMVYGIYGCRDIVRNGSYAVGYMEVVLGKSKG